MRRLVICLILVIVAGAAVVAPARASSSGIDDWNCVPDSAGAFPRPVILIHGLGGTADDWRVLAPELQAQGACVFLPEYGTDAGTANRLYGVAPASREEQELAAYVRRVRASTGSAQVDIVGHSAGAFMALMLGRSFGAAEVGKVVLLAPPTRGTTWFGITSMLDITGLRPIFDTAVRSTICPGCIDFLSGSDYLTSRRMQPLTVPGISYHLLSIRSDTVITPGGRRQFINEPGVENVLGEKLWPGTLFNHGTLPRDAGVIDWTITRLRR